MAILHTSNSFKKTKKQKYKSSEEAKRARELAESWEKLKSKWQCSADKSKKKINSVKLPTEVGVYVRDTPNISSLNSWVTGSVSSKQNKTYTGTSMIGISTLHKSNAVPVFSQQEAVEISKMRR